MLELNKKENNFCEVLIVVNDSDKIKVFSELREKYIKMFEKEILKPKFVKNSRDIDGLEESIFSGYEDFETYEDFDYDNLSVETYKNKVDWYMRRSTYLYVHEAIMYSVIRRFNNIGLSEDDKVSAGRVGFMLALNTFDESKGYKFSTYATWWIRQAITRAIADQARTIRVPVHMVETINKLARVQRQLTQELNREPTEEEIAKKLGVTVDKVREVYKISQDPVSLETPIGEEEDSHLGDFIPDEDVPAPAEAAAFSMLKEQLVEVLDTLTDREQKVLRLRFGLDDGRARTLEEVGKEFNVTRERIRQIEAKALRKLRHPSRSRKLKDYLD